MWCCMRFSYPSLRARWSKIGVQRRSEWTVILHCEKLQGQRCVGTGQQAGTRWRAHPGPPATHLPVSLWGPETGRGDELPLAAVLTCGVGVSGWSGPY